MNEKAYYLRKLLEYGVKRPEFQRQGNTTYCNLFAKSILSWQAARYWIPDWPVADFCYDITAMNPGKYLNEIMLNTLTGTEYDNVIRMAASGISTGGTHDLILPEQLSKYPHEVTEKQAYAYANEGIPVWAVSKALPPLGHEAIICPDDLPFDPTIGLLEGQAGWNCGFFRIKEIFGDIADLKYFIFPKNQEVF